jgi:hypothetical protein
MSPPPPSLLPPSRLPRRLRAEQLQNKHLSASIAPISLVLFEIETEHQYQFINCSVLIFHVTQKNNVCQNSFELN